MTHSLKTLILTAAVLAAAGSWAFQSVPDECVKALGTTPGKPIPNGLVFFCGKCIPPPYVVERRGTTIWINSRQVTGQIVDWNDFLKTQKNVSVTKKEEVVAPPPAPEETVAPKPDEVERAPTKVEASAKEEKNELDSLFDDDGPVKEAEPAHAASSASRPSASAPARPASKPSAPPAPTRRVTVTYALNGAFEPNEESKQRIARIETVRAEFDRVLKNGGFLCLGEDYPRVMGDKRLLLAMLKVLPEAMKESQTQKEFVRRMRKAELPHIYSNRVLCEELFRNRRDYRRLQVRRDRLTGDKRWQKVVDDASRPTF